MFKQIRTIVVFIAVVGTALSPVVVAAQSPVPSKSTNGNKLRVFDVRLNSEGQLVGAVVDVEGKPLAGQIVTIQSSAKTQSTAKNQAVYAMETKTDEHGLFRSRLSGGGLYQLKTESGITLVRIWTAKAAPPSATDNILIVEGGDKIVRGQRPIGDLFRINDPVLVATVTAAAIAIPIAIHNSRDDSKSGS